MKTRVLLSTTFILLSISGISQVMVNGVELTTSQQSCRGINRKIIFISQQAAGNITQRSRYASAKGIASRAIGIPACTASFGRQEFD